MAYTRSEVTLETPPIMNVFCRAKAYHSLRIDGFVNWIIRHPFYADYEDVE